MASPLGGCPGEQPSLAPSPCMHSLDHARPGAEEALLCALQGLEFLHSHGIIVMDIKPDNLFRNRSGTFQIGDFGLAITSSLDEVGTSVQAGWVAVSPGDPHMHAGAHACPLLVMRSTASTWCVYSCHGRCRQVKYRHPLLVVKHGKLCPVKP